MKITFKIAVFYFILSAPVSAFCDQAIVTSNIDQQKDVSITVYNTDLGLVRDVRNIAIPEGVGQLQFMDVASSVNPVTVHAQSLTNPQAFKILEQNYEYDLMDHNKILDKYVGKNIKLASWNEYQDRQTVVDATLLSNEGQVYQVGDQIYLGYPGYKIVPEIPKNLIAKPTLVWAFDNNEPKAQDLETTYLTGGISWKADYVAVLSKSDDRLDISGWVTLDNRSGTMYKNAQLKLVAGDVNRVAPPTPKMMNMMARAGGVAYDSAQEFQEKTFFDYHLYTLGRRTTIKNNQTKQISLLQAAGIFANKEYLANGNGSYYYQQSPEGKIKQDVDVYIKFKNSKDAGLGMPLPAGTMRMYKTDDDSSLQFVGEDNIGHTPEDEDIRLKAGQSFDIVAERRQMDYQFINSRTHQSEWEIVIRNHKDEDVVVDVIEPMSGEWKVLQNSHPFEKTSSTQLKFKVPVPKKGESVLKYRVSIEFR